MKERLDLLKQADVISQHAYLGTLEATRFLSGHLNIDPRNEQFQMAMTHLARAVDRITAGTPIDEGLDPEIFLEITKDDAYEQVSALNLTTLTFFDITAVPEAENSYLVSNLFSLLTASQTQEEAC